LREQPSCLAIAEFVLDALEQALYDRQPDRDSLRSPCSNEHLTQPASSIPGAVQHDAGGKSAAQLTELALQAPSGIRFRTTGIPIAADQQVESGHFLELRPIR
jgi:hypothetical protein